MLVCCVVSVLVPYTPPEALVLAVGTQAETCVQDATYAVHRSSWIPRPPDLNLMNSFSCQDTWQRVYPRPSQEHGRSGGKSSSKCEKYRRHWTKTFSIKRLTGQGCLPLTS